MTAAPDTTPLEERPAMDLLRFATAGSVDDGKSTLIGRLLLDSKAIFEDQLEAVESTSKAKSMFWPWVPTRLESASSCASWSSKIIFES